jgi:hypothetical protein
LKANVQFDKEDLTEMLHERLWRQGFQLPEGKEFDWKHRPTLHVLATVEPLQPSADAEAKARTAMVQRLRDCMAELQQLQRYGHVVRSLERAIVQLEHAEQDFKNGVIHEPLESHDQQDMMAALTQAEPEAPTMPPPAKFSPNQRIVPIEIAPDNFSQDIGDIVAKSKTIIKQRQLLANERLEDPRIQNG